MKYFFYSFLLVLFICQCRHKEENPVIQFSGKPGVPSSIKKEHENLLEQIHRITLFRDSAGLVARKLNDLMQHHFKEEEDLALPPLGVLSLLASGEIPEQSHDIIVWTEKLKSQLTHLSVEHQLIKAYMDELRQADTNGSHPEIIAFEKEVHKHANIEEEVFFPAAILIGEYLKLKVAIKP